MEREAGFYWLKWYVSDTYREVAKWDDGSWFFVGTDGELTEEYVETYYKIGPRIEEPEDE